MYRDIIVKNLYVYTREKIGGKERESICTGVRSMKRMRGRTKRGKRKEQQEKSRICTCTYMYIHIYYDEEDE